MEKQRRKSVVVVAPLVFIIAIVSISFYLVEIATRPEDVGDALEEISVALNNRDFESLVERVANAPESFGTRNYEERINLSPRARQLRKLYQAQHPTGQQSLNRVSPPSSQEQIAGMELVKHVLPSLVLESRSAKILDLKLVRLVGKEAATNLTIEVSVGKRLVNENHELLLLYQDDKWRVVFSKQRFEGDESYYSYGFWAREPDV